MVTPPPATRATQAQLAQEKKDRNGTYSPRRSGGSVPRRRRDGGGAGRGATCQASKGVKGRRSCDRRGRSWPEGASRKQCALIPHRPGRSAVQARRHQQDPVPFPPLPPDHRATFRRPPPVCRNPNGRPPHTRRSRLRPPPTWQPVATMLPCSRRATAPAGACGRRTAALAPLSSAHSGSTAAATPSGTPRIPGTAWPRRGQTACVSRCRAACASAHDRSNYKLRAPGPLPRTPPPPPPGRSPASSAGPSGRLRWTAAPTTRPSTQTTPPPSAPPRT